MTDYDLTKPVRLTEAGRDVARRLREGQPVPDLTDPSLGTPGRLRQPADRPRATPAERVAELEQILARQGDGAGPRAAVMAAISAAGMCWSDPAAAGVWDTEGSRAVAAWLLDHLHQAEAAERASWKPSGRTP